MALSYCMRFAWLVVAIVVVAVAVVGSRLDMLGAVVALFGLVPSRLIEQSLHVVCKFLPLC